MSTQNNDIPKEGDPTQRDGQASTQRDGNPTQQNGQAPIQRTVLQVNPNDNVLVALTNLLKDERVIFDGQEYQIQEPVKAKHKFATVDLATGDPIIMYGVLVGKAQEPIKRGGLISTANVRHAANDFSVGQRKTEWAKPDVSKFAGRTFNGYHRADGSVGVSNYWVVIPMVFCENRNLDVLQQALVNDLGYGRNRSYQLQAKQLVELYKAGKDVQEILQADLQADYDKHTSQRLFPNLDGIKFLTHDGGCGGTRQDAQALCGLLAGYITHPNVAGVTVLSLGCQNAQVGMLEEEIRRRSPQFSKPMVILEQQKIGKESDLLSEAIKQTFAGLIVANCQERAPAPLSKICMRRIGWVLGHLRQPGYRLYFRSAGRAGRFGHPFRIPGIMRRGAEPERSLYGCGYGRAFFIPDEDL
jgi:altronate hydrolase